MARVSRWGLAPTVVLLLAGCGGQGAERDAVSAAMKQAVENSQAKVRVAGRSDWEADRRSETYWVRVDLHNEGGPGLVAIRVAIRSMVPYVSIGVSPTEPQYFEMGAGETRELRLTGEISAEAADRAMGCVVEVYPEAPETPQSVRTAAAGFISEWKPCCAPRGWQLPESASCRSRRLTL